MPKQETIGIVISNKMQKTITVAVKTKTAHKKYSKTITKTHKYYVHDENNQCEMGDVVKIQATKPISKQKRWTFVNRITK
uniref:Small ribosomal subunit protein uS17c n=1 Tax=Betaphycus gelatinus TaxID=1191690 RepID=A0A8E7PGU5_9FLOR|nr:30S ribosomal protein S17 [Betaphycus gelatinus]